jgi:K+-transporting ATPase ATPase C chain
LLFPKQANGSLIRGNNGNIIGSELLGQSFRRANYFHPRPSANHYDAANSGGSNWGGTNKKLVDRIAEERQQYAELNQWPEKIPMDAVTASGSGLDPHITLANALAQASRIADVRGLSSEEVNALIVQQTEKPLFSQSPYLNVLHLNLALDQIQKKGTSHGL